MQHGFTLVEMAIVLVIFGLVLSALLLPLSAQRGQVAQTQTVNTLENAKQALLGFAQANGRLPCPATIGSKGLEDQTPANSGKCTQETGLLPAATLGIQPINPEGFAVDNWNNPIRFAVSQKNNAGVLTTHFTTANEMSNQGMVNLQPNLRVCNTAELINVAKCSDTPEKNYLINNAVAVIYSTGATGAQGSNGRADELANLDGDTVFVSHDIRLGSQSDPNEFDHIVTWISPYVLYNAMIQAGQLH